MASPQYDLRELLAAQPSCRLPRGMGVLDVAEECRRASLAFVDGTPPTKRALAAWLEGPYRALVSIAPHQNEPPVRADQVTEVAAFSRAYVIGVMRGLARSPSDVSFTIAAMHGAWIERCCDATGRPGWLPVDRPNMRLTERVLSLLAVDYLVRPAAWLGGNIAKIAV